LTGSDGAPKNEVTYYTISDHRFFPGAIALLNSLRLTGNAGELVVLDAGLTPIERELLSDHATVFAPPQQIEGNPVLMKAYPHLLEPSGIVVLIDSDMIVTGSLDHVRDIAREGKICAYPDPPETRKRWFAEWHEVLELRAPLRREVCVNSGFLAFSTDRWPDLLGRWWEVCELIPATEVFGAGTSFNAGDQDALNALLMSEIPREGLALLPEAEEAFGGDARVEDVETLTCTSAGRQTKVLHYVDRPKPWERSGWLRLAATGYVRLMRRLLFAPDVPLRLDPGQLPLWLRPSLGGELALRSLGAANRAIVWSSHKAPRPLQERLRRMRRRLGVSGQSRARARPHAQDPAGRASGPDSDELSARVG
jgi:hypothetical protein